MNGIRNLHERMRRHRLQASGCIAALLLAALANAAEQTNAPATPPPSAPAKLDYNAFRTISDRNIFNPNRYARSSGKTTRTDSRPASRVESLSLVGLMAYEKGVFAFFDGTKSDYKKVLPGPGEISEFKVTSVTPDLVHLSAGTNDFVLRVGTQVRRDDEGDWYLADARESGARKRVVVSRGRSSTGTHNGTATGDATEMTGDSEGDVIVIDSNTTGEATDSNGESPRTEGATSTPGISDPVLLRLMQRRQELNQ